MADDGITADEYARWLTTTAARDVAARTMSLSDAGVAVFRLVSQGLIDAASGSSARNAPSGNASRREPAIIDPDLWAKIDHNASRFWAGIAVFTITRRNSMTVEGISEAIISHFGIRVRPEDVARQFQGEVPAPASRPAETDEGDTAKHRIQDEWLAAWADLFNRLYPNEDADFALKSARGMFHDKQVSRDRVRPLVQRPRGRPTRK